MRAPIIVLTVMLSGVAALPDAAYAQLTPQRLLNGISRPFRQVLGARHYPRSHRHRTANAERMIPADADASNPSAMSLSTDARLGRAGPATWPSAYEDVLGFTFWPDDYAPRLRGHGFDVIADTITGQFNVPRARARTATTGSAVQNDSGASAAACQDTADTADTAGAQDSWPAVRVGQTIQISNAQHDALDNVQATVTQSSKAFKADCSDPNALAAPDRLGALVRTLWTVHDAGVAARTPLKNFTETLTPAQKAGFASRLPQDIQKPDPKNPNPAMHKQYQACAAQNVQESERMIKQIEMRVRPNKAQAASLENLHKVSSDMARLLMASCAQPIPSDPVARLDAAADQLTAMNYAATTVQIAFNDFYSRLDHAQQARFDSVGR